MGRLCMAVPTTQRQNVKRFQKSWARACSAAIRLSRSEVQARLERAREHASGRAGVIGRDCAPMVTRGAQSLATNSTSRGDEMNDKRRNRIEDVRAAIDNWVGEIEALATEEQDAFDNMPENLQESERGQASEESANQLNEAVSAAEELVNCLQAAMEG